MSTIKQIFVCVVMISSSLIFSQQTNNNDDRPFLVTLNDPLVAHYSVSKDSSMLSISFYVNGYESKQKREKVIKAHQDELNKQKRRDYVRLPTFYLNYFDTEKPEKIINLDCDYRTLNELFSSNTRFLIHIIIRQDDGTYLKWSPVLLSEE